MTAREVTSAFARAYPTTLGDDTLVYWVSEIEGTIFEEIVMTHEGAEAPSFEGITLNEGMEKELIAKEPYSKLYMDYLRMKSDAVHSDTARYAESSAMFAASYADFADYYNRRHMPKQEATTLNVG